jgi:hypothetical protein
LHGKNLLLDSHLQTKFEISFATQNWFIWALLSAVFAALTAILAKVGLERVNSDFRHPAQLSLTPG